LFLTIFVFAEDKQNEKEVSEFDKAINEDHEDPGK